MIEILSQPQASAYTFASSRYFCTNCNRQFSSIKVDQTSTVARCPRCNLYADEITSNTQVSNNTRATPQNQSRRAQPSSQRTSNNNNNNNNRRANTNTYRNPENFFSSFFSNPLGGFFSQPQRNSGMEIEMDNTNAFIDPFGAFFGGSAMPGFNFYQAPAYYDDATIEEFLRNDPNKYGPPPASDEAINKLQEVKFNPEGAETKCCPVCQEDYKEGEPLVKLPCGHEYHKDCVTSWLTQHNSCPMCRKEI